MVRPVCKLFTRNISSTNLLCNLCNLCYTHDVKKMLASAGVPRNATRPSAISKILSNMAYTSDEGWCIVQIMVLPFNAIDFNTVTTVWAINESKPDVGSSQNIIGGFVNTYKNLSIRVNSMREGLLM